MGNVFISYRRQDSAAEAQRLRRLLADRFSDASVFLDLREHLEPGTDFTAVLEARIATADMALAVIGPDWNPLTGSGLRRLYDKNDYVRLELSIALSGKIPVVPVLVDKAGMPAPGTLPPKLRQLAHRQAVSLPPRRFNEAVKDLINHLDGLRSVTLEVAGASATKSALLRLSILGAAGNTLRSRATILLHREDTGGLDTFDNVDVSRRVVIRGLDSGVRYVLDVQVSGYRAVRWAVSAVPWKDDTVYTIQVPVDPTKVRRVEFPVFTLAPRSVQRLCKSSSVDRAAGRLLYQRLDPIRKAQLLNCMARADTLAFAPKSTLGQLLDQHASIADLRADRLFLKISNEAGTAIELALSQRILEPVPAALHAAPPGYRLVASGKARDLLLGFQATLFKGKVDYLLELEFDSWLGLQCAFRVIDEDYRGQTHPYDVHELLLRQQSVDPGYGFKVH